MKALYVRLTSELILRSAMLSLIQSPLPLTCTKYWQLLYTAVVQLGDAPASSIENIYHDLLRFANVHLQADLFTMPLVLANIDRFYKNGHGCKT